MTTPTPSGSPVLVRMSDVTPVRTSWLWQARIPFGKLTLLDGDPKLGKSTLTSWMAAQVSRGWAFPGSPPPNEAAGVVMLSAEDGADDTIAPRLRAADADCTRVTLLTGVRYGEAPPDLPSLPRDLNSVRAAVQATAARLVVIDPLMAYLGADVNSYRDQDVRRALHPLKEMAEATGCAVVVVRHLNKSNGSALYRGGGSIGIAGAARSVLIVAEHPEDPSQRILAVTAGNLAPLPPSLAFQLVTDEAHDCAKVEWLGETAHTANDLVVSHREEDRSEIDEAVEFLRDLLEPGELAANAVYRKSGAAGISRATLQRAKKKLGIKPHKSGMDGGWLWRLPEDAQVSTFEDAHEESEGAHVLGVSTFGEGEHLRLAAPWTPSAHGVGPCGHCGEPAETTDENGAPCHVTCGAAS